MTDKDKSPLTEGEVKNAKKPKASSKKPKENPPAPKPKKEPKAKATEKAPAKKTTAKKSKKTEAVVTTEAAPVVQQPVETPAVNVFAVAEPDNRTRFQRVMDWLIKAFS